MHHSELQQQISIALHQKNLLSSEQRKTTIVVIADKRVLGGYVATGLGCVGGTWAGLKK